MARLRPGHFRVALTTNSWAGWYTEEMAPYLTVNMAETLIETGGFDDRGWMAALPPWRREDDDPGWARTALFRDHDVLWVFEASLDGLEALDRHESLYCGLDHVHPRDSLVRFDDGPR